MTCRVWLAKDHLLDLLRSLIISIVISVKCYTAERKEPNQLISQRIVTQTLYLVSRQNLMLTLYGYVMCYCS